jgi:hypothetical protein
MPILRSASTSPEKRFNSPSNARTLRSTSTRSPPTYDIAAFDGLQLSELGLGFKRDFSSFSESDNGLFQDWALDVVEGRKSRTRRVTTNYEEESGSEPEPETETESESEMSQLSSRGISPSTSFTSTSDVVEVMKKTGLMDLPTEVCQHHLPI